VSARCVRPLCPPVVSARCVRPCIWCPPEAEPLLAAMATNFGCVANIDRIGTNEKKPQENGPKNYC